VGIAVSVTGGQPHWAQGTVIFLNRAAGWLNGATNTVYELQYIPDVVSTNWIGLTNFVMPSKTSVFRFVDTEATNASQRFYRAVAIP
jgi:hypothetical protein